ncbi:hypothetical protein V494_00038 [Pseudogymnoascus sp. VKM F-4513 (FW-928)]|nr:hypothetical protein V494_00038 [Pseudogymnoascus sp. VKM F-4513 (FW-928)]
MPFGLTNAPASMQRLMNDALHEYLDIFVIVYLDDILVYSTSKEEHVKHVKLVLEKIEKYNLLLKLEKCEFYIKQVEFLVKEVQAFLGFANFYCRFIAGYSKELKTKFTEAPILATFDPTKKIILKTDSSDFAIRACLNQPDKNGKFKPIAYYSRKLSPVELNYDIHDKELLAIVAETLVAYNFTITYRKGSENARADALSRRTDYISPKEERPRVILKETDVGMQYNELLATIATIENSELEDRLKKAYITDECAKRVLTKVEGDFAIDEQGLIRFKGFKEASRDSGKRVRHLQQVEIQQALAI